jgi:hypothetical protein
MESRLRRDGDEARFGYVELRAFGLVVKFGLVGIFAGFKSGGVFVDWLLTISPSHVRALEARGCFRLPLAMHATCCASLCQESSPYSMHTNISVNLKFPAK